MTKRVHSDLNSNPDPNSTSSSKFLSFAIAFSLLCTVFVGVATPKPARADIDLWPLFEKREDSTTVLYPLYVREPDFQMVFPFYYRTNKGKDTHLLWPLVKLSEGRLERAAPFWFSAQTGEFTLFPLIHRDRLGTTTLIPPAYTAADGSQTMFIPFYSRSEVSRGGRSEEKLSVLWPLWSRSVWRNADGVAVRRDRRALIFSQEWERGQGRVLSVLGVPVREAVE